MQLGLVDVDLAPADVGPGRQDRQPQARAERTLGFRHLGTPSQLGAAGRAWHPQLHEQLRIVLMRDQDLRDVSLGGETQLHAVTGQRCWKSRKRRHASVADRSLVDAMTAPTTSLRRNLRDAGDELPFTVRRSDRARRVRVTVDAVRGVEVVLPRRASGRCRRRRGAGARSLDPPPAGGARDGAFGGRRPRGHGPVPRDNAAAGAAARTHARAPPRRRAARARRRRHGSRRWSGGTGARPVARSRRGLTGHASRPACPTHGSRSALSARAGRAAHARAR